MGGLPVEAVEQSSRGWEEGVIDLKHTCGWMKLWLGSVKLQGRVMCVYYETLLNETSGNQ